MFTAKCAAVRTSVHQTTLKSDNVTVVKAYRPSNPPPPVVTTPPKQAFPLLPGGDFHYDFQKWELFIQESEAPGHVENFKIGHKILEIANALNKIPLEKLTEDLHRRYQDIRTRLSRLLERHGEYLEDQLKNMPTPSRKRRVRMEVSVTPLTSEVFYSTEF